MKIRVCVECGNKLHGQKVKYCSNKCKQKYHYHQIKLQSNTYHSQTIRGLRRKLKLVEMNGGKCSHCGYDSNLSAMHFHHRNSYEKEFKLDLRSLSNRRWDLILEESYKCDILCANCHSEIHNPELSKENVEKIVRDNNRGKLSTEVKKYITGRS